MNIPNSNIQHHIKSETYTFGCKVPSTLFTSKCGIPSSNSLWCNNEISSLIWKKEYLMFYNWYSYNKVEIFHVLVRNITKGFKVCAGMNSPRESKHHIVFNWRSTDTSIQCSLIQVGKNRWRFFFISHSSSIICKIIL